MDEEPIRGNATAKPIIIIIIINRQKTKENITMKSVCFSDTERLFIDLHKFQHRFSQQNLDDENVYLDVW